MSAVLGRLDGEARERLRRQVDSINLVQRHARAREVNCYPMRWGRPHREDAIRFADRRKEASLARVSFRTRGVTRAGRAVVGLVEGYFFSIAFDRPPPEVRSGDQVQVLGVEVLTDPMTPRVEAEEGTPPPLESLRGEGVLCVREPDDRPGLYFMGYDGAPPVPLASFVGAVEAFLDGGTPALRRSG